MLMVFVGRLREGYGLVRDPGKDQRSGKVKRLTAPNVVRTRFLALRLFLHLRPRPMALL